MSSYYNLMSEDVDQETEEFQRDGPELPYHIALSHCEHHDCYKGKMSDKYAGFAERSLDKHNTPVDLFQYVHDAMSQAGLVPVTLMPKWKISLQLYNPETSTSKMAAGFKCFDAGMYWDACKLYTEAMVAARPGTESFAIALANRSAALYLLDKFQLCLDDVRRALDSNFPANTTYELYDRVGDAHRRLGHRSDALDGYLEGLELLSDAFACPVNDDETHEKRLFALDIISKFIDVLVEAPNEEEVQSFKRLPPVNYLIGGKNELIPALSKRLEVRPSTNGNRRGVYATCDINPGEVVAIEQPYISGPAPYYNTTCHYGGCLKITRALIVCPKCSLAYYCNELCLKNAFEDGHDVVCPILHAIKKIPGNSYLNQLVLKWFVKECSKVDVQTFCSLLSKTFNETTTSVNKNKLFMSEDFLNAFSLNTGGTFLNDVFYFYCMAVEIIEYLILSGFNVPKCYKATAGASIAQMLNVLESNCRRLFVYNPSMDFITRKDMSYPIAYALYPSIGLFNHSCDANVKPSGLISDKMRVLKAIRPIPKGSELLVSYGVDFNLDTIDTRQIYCMDNFNFICTCQPCLENWPMVQSIPNSIYSLNLINPKMADAVILECNKFIAFQERTRPNEYQHHLNYLYRFNKFMFANVKRPYVLYEICLSMLSTAHSYYSLDNFPA